MSESRGRITRLSRRFLTILLFTLLAELGYAQEECKQWLGKLASAQGQVDTKRAGEINWTPVKNGDLYCVGDAIRTGRESRAVLLLNTHDKNKATSSLNENTVMTFLTAEEEKPSMVRLILDLLQGGALFRSRRSNSLNIRTPYVNAAHRGTEFLVVVDKAQTQLTVFDGQVVASNSKGKLTLDKGESGLAKLSQAPIKYKLLRPGNAVQWALYYPPLIDYQAASSIPSSPAIESALKSYLEGEPSKALAIMNRVPTEQRDPRYFTLKAGFLLSVGRVDQAQPTIKRALTLDLENATAVALQSVISMTQNRTDKALALAQRAAELDPESPTPHVALSYAYQSMFDIDKALQSAEKAVELGSGNALAWSRLSELRLSMGELDDALAAAQKAIELNPRLSRTRTVLGFAYFTQINIDEARAAFEKAIKLDPAAPLPRLGLGIAKIREGDLSGGTDDIEVAASLDPDNSLIRSYLGKAFYEKKEGRLASTELAIAKELDPKDPTPWFYNAILKRSQNRPVEALHELKKSIALNDNKAIYRSRLLLDEDRAVRGASLASIYGDLGFNQLALVEASKSVTSDPASHSAHRFLADSYARLPRHEVARISELFQAQLLQSINNNPIQPQLALTNLSVSPEASFNEFSSLFETEKPRLLATGIVGNNGSWGNEAFLSGLYKKFAYSLNQLHYETDGFRENNDLKQNSYDVLGQVAVTPKLNLQAEFKRRETDQGDLTPTFDSDNFFGDRRATVRQNLGRLGIRYTPSPNSDFILSYLYNEKKTKFKQSDFDFIFENDVDEKGNQAEFQYLFRANRFDITAGGGYSMIDVKDSFRISLFNLSDRFETNQRNGYGYAYTNIDFPKDLTWTLGLSYDSLDIDDGLDLDELGPKLGLQWNIGEQIRLRLAAMKTLKRSLIENRTTEPTQVAGFNQFFDDTLGTKAKRYGIGLDISFTENLYGGIEVARRDLDVPLTVFGADGGQSVEFEDQREQLYRSYLYWTPHRQWAISGEFRFERLKREDSFIFSSVDGIQTMSVPLSARYFNPSGFFAGLGAIYVKQKVEGSEFDFAPSKSDQFLVLDASIGYRLPKRWGIISLEAQNLLDEEFNFQSENIQSDFAVQGQNIQISRPTNPRFIPDRSIFLRMTLNF